MHRDRVAVMGRLVKPGLMQKIKIWIAGEEADQVNLDAGALQSALCSAVPQVLCCVVRWW